MKYIHKAIAFPERWFSQAALMLLTFLMANTAQASHIAGAEITYACINNCTVRVHLRGFRDCSGTSIVGSNVSFTALTPGCTQPTAASPLSAVVVTELPPLCPNASTMCTNPNASINGIEEHYSQRDYDICSIPNCIYRLEWSTCCRSPIINSINTPNSSSIYLSSVTLNTNFATCNSAPQFLHPALPYICAGQTFSISQAANDLDGDSLSYELGSCMQSSTNPVIYNSGYSATSPLGPSWDVQINATTGQLTFSPQPGMAVTGVICIVVKEWRNGNLIGQVVRDIQTQALVCPSFCGGNLTEGTVYDDFNSNCIKDLGEPGLQNVQIAINGGLGIVVTDQQGKYQAWLSSGSYTLEVLEPQDWLFQTTCPTLGSHSVAFSGQNDTLLNQDFGLEAIQRCPQMTVDLATALVRPCVSSTYHVSYCNQGSDTAWNAYVTIALEPYQTYMSVSGATWLSSNGNLHTFSIGDVPYGQCGAFSFVAMTDCNMNLTGATACAEAHIYPDSSCVGISPLWDGSSVVLEGECVADSLVCFTILNNGQAMQGPTDWRYYRNSVLTLSGSLQLCGGCDTVMCFAANGSTDRLEVDQRPNHPGNSAPSSVIELCGQPLGVVGHVTTLDLDDDDPFVAIYCEPVINSYDPNSKSGMPSGATAPFYYIDSTDAISYFIDFQNTGSADALRVVLQDILDPRLDILTVQPGASSHPYTFSVVDGRKLKFTFENINLPAASMDSTGSIGWVRYSVKQVPGNTFGDEIRNHCDIFFD
ncbi:MAG TPA: SdrD B-like domain-containing protein, partial [Bacteroidia bacterium]|nr:SdrD B-like domain-containing protein [Bacteroidia bacterium]